jgi:hypothetical protein
MEDNVNEMTYTLLTEVYGRLEAEALKAFLFSEGIDAELIQEGAGQYAYPLTVGELGRVQVFVPRKHLENAQSLLEEFEKGALNVEIAESDSNDAQDEDETHDE